MANLSYPQRGPDWSPGLKSIDAEKSDSVDLTEPYRGFHVGVAGNVKFTPTDGSTAVTIAVNAGAYYPYGISRLWSTGTTATGIHGVR